MHQFPHVPTLFSVTALVIAFSGLLLLLARHSDDSTNAPALWGGAILTGASGLVLLALGPVLPTFLTQDVAHALILHPAPRSLDALDLRLLGVAPA